MFYFVKTPWLLKKLYPDCIWNLPTKQNTLYLTFDDGPHAEATKFVLDELRKYNAKATFFCIGKNVVAEPALYRRILDEGHRTGNHSYDHLNGWKTDNEIYFQNIHKASQYIDSRLFRPPYGRVTRFQLANLIKAPLSYRVVMWDVLSADFDIKLSGETCAGNVIKHAGKGSVIIFHDSAKALPRLQIALPMVLKNFSEKGFSFEVIQ